MCVQFLSHSLAKINSSMTSEENELGYGRATLIQPPVLLSCIERLFCLLAYLPPTVGCELSREYQALFSSLYLLICLVRCLELAKT